MSRFCDFRVSTTCSITCETCGRSPDFVRPSLEVLKKSMPCYAEILSLLSKESSHKKMYFYIIKKTLTFMKPTLEVDPAVIGQVEFLKIGK